MRMRSKGLKPYWVCTVRQQDGQKSSMLSKILHFGESGIAKVPAEGADGQPGSPVRQKGSAPHCNPCSATAFVCWQVCVHKGTTGTKGEKEEMRLDSRQEQQGTGAAQGGGSCARGQRQHSMDGKVWRQDKAHVDTKKKKEIRWMDSKKKKKLRWMDSRKEKKLRWRDTKTKLRWRDSKKRKSSGGGTPRSCPGGAGSPSWHHTCRLVSSMAQRWESWDVWITAHGNLPAEPSFKSFLPTLRWFVLFQNTFPKEGIGLARRFEEAQRSTGYQFFQDKFPGLLG